jgi:hypothetical protein
MTEFCEESSGIKIQSLPLVITDMEFGRMMVYKLATNGMRLEIPRAVEILIGSYNLQQTLCSLIGGYQHFRRTHCLLLQGSKGWFMLLQLIIICFS